MRNFPNKEYDDTVIVAAEPSPGMTGTCKYQLFCKLLPEQNIALLYCVFQILRIWIFIQITIC